MPRCDRGARTDDRQRAALQGLGPLLHATEVKTAAFSAQYGEHVMCNPTGGGFTVTLPRAADHRDEYVGAKNDAASGNLVTVASVAGETIDGAASLALADRASMVWQSNGSNWLTVWDYSASGGGGTPAGSSTWIQFNNAGAFGASAYFTLDVSGSTILRLEGAFYVLENSAIHFYDSGNVNHVELNADTLTGNRVQKLPDADGTLLIDSVPLTISGADGRILYNNGGDIAVSGIDYDDATDQVTLYGDLLIDDSSKGLVLTSPDSSTGRIQNNNADVPYVASGGAMTLTRVMSADQSINNSTTLANVTDLVFPIGANETWVYEIAVLAVATLTATGAKIAVTVPAGASILAMATLSASGDPTVFNSNQATLYATSSGSAMDFDIGTPFISGFDEALFMVRVSVANGATPGNVQLKFAQSTSDAANLTFKQGSFGTANLVT